MRPRTQAPPIAAAKRSFQYNADSHNEGKKIGSHSSVFVWARIVRSNRSSPVITGARIPTFTRVRETCAAIQK